MTSWVMTLNEMSPELERLLPPTDTRLRADIRAVEDGIYDHVCPTFLYVLSMRHSQVKSWGFTAILADYV